MKKKTPTFLRSDDFNKRQSKRKNIQLLGESACNNIVKDISSHLKRTPIINYKHKLLNSDMIQHCKAKILPVHYEHTWEDHQEKIFIFCTILPQSHYDYQDCFFYFVIRSKDASHFKLTCNHNWHSVATVMTYRGELSKSNII